MRKLNTLLSIATIACGLTTASAQSAPSAQISIPADTLHYSIKYHLGFIDKEIAHGVAQFRSSEADGFTASLSGSSIPWEGRQYSITDTLSSTFSNDAETGLPVETIRYINGVYTKPLCHEGPNGQLILEQTGAFKNIHGEGTLDASPLTMEAVTITARMLSMFYYAHALPFENWQPGQVVKLDINMPDGDNAFLEIKYVGERQHSNDDGTSSAAYAMIFNYSYKGELSKYPVECEIDATRRVPLFFSADLTIGHMMMSLVP